MVISDFGKTLMRTKLLCAIVWIPMLAAIASAQNGEISAFIGRQANGGLDLSTTTFQRIEVHNGVNYGLSAGYLTSEHTSVEFLWNYNKADTLGERRTGGESQTVFTLDTNQYLGNFLYHFSPREAKTRPFVLVGVGATNLHAAMNDVKSITRLAWTAGGGVKYNLTPRLGVRFQAKWSPTYITTTSNGGFWCDPFWGGCWVVGNSHFLNEFDATAGLTLRF